MKNCCKPIILLFVLAIVMLLSSCVTTSYVHDGTGAYYVVSINTYGKCDFKGKTFYIESGDENISSNDLEFREFSGYLKENLKIKGAQETTDKNSADLCILMNYCITDKSYQESIPVPDYGRTTIASSETKGNKTTYNYNYGTTGYHYVQNNVSNFLRIVNIYVYDNKTLDSEPVMLMKTNLKSEGSSSNLREVVPHILFAGLIGFYADQEKTLRVAKDGYQFKDWKRGKYTSPNYTKLSPLYAPGYSDASHNGVIIIEHLEKLDNKTLIGLAKNGCMTYKIPTELYLCVDGKETRVSYADNYSLGQTIVKECGVRFITLHFPISIKEGVTSVELKEYTNSSHTNWRSWGILDLTEDHDEGVLLF